MASCCALWREGREAQWEGRRVRLLKRPLTQGPPARSGARQAPESGMSRPDHEGRACSIRSGAMHSATSCTRPIAPTDWCSTRHARTGRRASQRWGWGSPRIRLAWSAGSSLGPRPRSVRSPRCDSFGEASRGPSPTRPGTRVSTTTFSTCRPGHALGSASCRPWTPRCCWVAC